MKGFALALALATALACGGTATAAQTLQMDMNALGVQVTGTNGAPSPFGGLNHTGTVNLSAIAGTSAMVGVFIDAVNQNFSGTMTSMTGVVNLTNGNVTGGSISVTVNGTDTYTASIANVGYVENYIGGGFTVQGLTFNGAFNSTNFGNVNVTPWATGGLPGSFLQFNFAPNANGSGYADIDLFVQVIPLPPAAAMGVATLGGLMLASRFRRRA
jgi:hypothetical protein